MHTQIAQPRQMAAAHMAQDDYTRPPSLVDGLASLLGVVRGASPAASRLDYLPDDADAQSSSSTAAGPSWGARMCYGAGLAYISALAAGGLWGLADGARNPLGAPSARLRLNCVLNACTARGPFLANSAACAALLYNGVHGGVLRAAGREQDVLSAAGSAGLAAAVFRSARGVRPAAGAAAVAAAAMAAYQLAAGRTIRL